MRVVLNQHAAFGPRTGIGHYTGQLLRCLRELTEPGEIDARPGPWLNGFRHLLTRPSRPGTSLAKTPARATRGLASATTTLLRPCWQALMRLSFRRGPRPNPFPLYHEPNFIPFPCHIPPVATVHDLSVVLHPEWPPPDRVRHFEKHFRKGLGQCVHYFAISEA